MIDKLRYIHKKKKISKIKKLISTEVNIRYKKITLIKCL